MKTSSPCTPRSPLSTAQHAPTGDLSARPRGALPPDPCDLVTVPARQGLEAVDILRRADAESVGPVLHDGSCDTLGFLVPPGTADEWDVPGSACTQTSGRGVAFDPQSAPPVDGTGWLLPPDGADPVTDPEVLREALDEAARMIEAADNCC